MNLKEPLSWTLALGVLKDVFESLWESRICSFPLKNTTLSWVSVFCRDKRRHRLAREARSGVGPSAALPAGRASVQTSAALSNTAILPLMSWGVSARPPGCCRVHPDVEQWNTNDIHLYLPHLFLIRAAESVGAYPLSKREDYILNRLPVRTHTGPSSCQILRHRLKRHLSSD